MDLSVIIVSWNVKDKLRANLEALYSSIGSLQFEVFVVDNASADGSAAMVRENFPSVKLIANQENLGFAKANNQAIKQAVGKFILLLNPDMLVDSDTLAKAVSWAQQNERATVSGFRLVDAKGEIVRQIRRFPRFFDQLMIILKLPHLFPHLLDAYLCADFDYSQAAKVDSIRGAFFLINTEAHRRLSGQEKPLLDERYFVWFEEVDFCRQVAKLGGEVWYSPAAQCRDYIGQSFGQLKRSAAQEYFRASMLAYFQKWEKPWQYRGLRAAWGLVRLFLK